MNKNLLFCLAFLLIAVKVGAQDSFSVRAQRYIEQYSIMAMAEQQRSGIPASVTLAQGVLETEAGKSELACSANNHFGIKCKADYAGDKFFHDDDAPKECFKMYKCAEDSYKDHSDYLKRNPRYTPLFSLSQTDYASWAICLKKCGYATNPQYAQRLIKIIEDFKLQQYTYAAMDSSFMPNQKIALKTGNPLKESYKAPPIAGPQDTITKIVLTTFDPVDKPTTAAKAKPKAVAKDSIKTIPAPVAEVVKPTIETAQTVAETPKPTTTTSFAVVKNMADSAHHIIVHDGPMPLQTKDAPTPDSPLVAKVAAASPQASIDTKYDSGKIITVNGLKAFYAYKGEILLQYAVKYNIRYPHLLEINDLPDGPLDANMPVYLEKKLSSGTHARHTVKDGETMFLIAQAEGMQLKRLLALNMMDIGDEPAIGTILELQNGVFRKPALRAVSEIETQPNTTTLLGKSTPPADLITINRPKPATTPVVKLADTLQHEKAQPYVETISVNKPAVTETTATTTIPVATQTVTTTPVVTQTIAKADTAHPVVAAEQKQDTTVDELAALKAELDKVVYTDDSKLLNNNPKTTNNTVTPTTKKEEQKTVKEVKETKKKAEAKSKESKYYVIKEGETLGGIANRHDVTVKQLMRWNNIKADQIRAGKKLRVKE